MKLLFSQRNRIGTDINKWLRENKASNHPQNVIAWLDSKGMINRENLLKYLREQECQSETALMRH